MLKQEREQDKADACAGDTDPEASTGETALVHRVARVFEVGHRGRRVRHVDEGRTAHADREQAARDLFDRDHARPLLVVEVDRWRRRRRRWAANQADRGRVGLDDRALRLVLVVVEHDAVCPGRQGQIGRAHV